MKVGTLLLVIYDTVGYLVELGLIDELGNMKAPSVQQDLQIAAFVETSLKKHGVVIDDIVDKVLQILPLVLAIAGVK